MKKGVTMDVKECVKYKKQLLRMDILNVAASACVFFAMMLFAFVELFQVKFGGNVLYGFSVFSQFKDGIKNLKDYFADMRSAQSGGMSALQPMTSAISIVAFAAAALVMVCTLVEVIKNGVGFLNYDKKLLIKYDKVKRGVPASAPSMVILCFIALIVNVGCVVAGKNFKKLFGEDITFQSDYMLVNGVSWTVMFSIIFLLASVVLVICTKKIYKDVAYEIMKDGYSYESGKEKNNSAESADGSDKK